MVSYEKPTERNPTMRIPKRILIPAALSAASLLFLFLLTKEKRKEDRPIHYYRPNMANLHGRKGEKIVEYIRNQTVESDADIKERADQYIADMLVLREKEKEKKEKEKKKS